MGPCSHLGLFWEHEAELLCSLALLRGNGPWALEARILGVHACGAILHVRRLAILLSCMLLAVRAHAGEQALLKVLPLLELPPAEDFHDFQAVQVSTGGGAMLWVPRLMEELLMEVLPPVSLPVSMKSGKATAENVF